MTSVVDRKFVTAGRAVFTLEVPAAFRASYGKQYQLTVAPHYTFRVEHVEANGKWSEAWFVGLLTGSDNTKDYSYLGVLSPAKGELRLTAKSCRTERHVAVKLLRRVLARVWEGRAEEILDAGFTLHHEGQCCRCGRALTTPESVERGIGPECFKIMAKEGGR